MDAGCEWMLMLELDAIGMAGMLISTATRSFRIPNTDT